MRYDHLDLFTGIGGFHIAAKAAGFQTVGFAEIESYSRKVLAARFPGIPNIGDVRIRGNFARFRCVRVVSAGYPCQPVSLAGERRGSGDDRWLWPACRDILEDLRPAWFVGENTLGHVSMGLDGVLADLEGLGYSVQPFVIPACSLGAWQRRGRVWIVAHLDSEREQQPQGSLEEGRGRAAHEGVPPGVVDGLGRGQGAEAPPAGESIDFDGGEDPLADAARRGREGRRLQEAPGRPIPPLTHADPLRSRLPGTAQRGAHGEGESGRAWNEYLAGLFGRPPVPPLLRVVHGIPNRAHRVKGLGNSIVPIVAEVIFTAIAEQERRKWLNT